jgi:hypothetical protein
MGRKHELFPLVALSTTWPQSSTLDRIGAFKAIWPKYRETFHSSTAEFAWLIHWSLSPPLTP